MNLLVSFLRNYWKPTLAVILIYLTLLCLPDGLYQHPFFKDFKGNLLSVVLTSAIFLLLALLLNRGLERTVEAIIAAVTDMQTIQHSWQREREEEWSKQRFKEFMEKESHHNILITGTDFVFLIQPVREGGLPKLLDNEREGLYIIKVAGPAYRESLSKEKLDTYNSSGIKTGEYYFCQFRNDSWHLSPEALGPNWKPFVLYGRAYGMGIIPIANEMMDDKEKFKEMEEVLDLDLTTDGEDAEEAMKTRFEVNINQFRLFKDSNGQTWLKTRNAPPKKVYYTNSPTDELHWHLVIEDFSNYLSDDHLRRFKDMLKRKAAEKKIDVPQIHWGYLH